MTSRKRSQSSPLRKLAGLVALAIALGGTSAMANARNARDPRGSVVTGGIANKAVAIGPIAFHAYSQFSGGSLYTARVVTGTDRDCQDRQAGANTTLPADRVVTFAVPAGQVACLATATKGSFELLWHALPGAASAPLVLAKGKN